MTTKNNSKVQQLLLMKKKRRKKSQRLGSQSLNTTRVRKFIHADTNAEVYMARMNASHV